MKRLFAVLCAVLFLGGTLMFLPVTVDAKPMGNPAALLTGGCDYDGNPWDYSTCSSAYYYFPAGSQSASQYMWAYSDGASSAFAYFAIGCTSQAYISSVSWGRLSHGDYPGDWAEVELEVYAYSGGSPYHILSIHSVIIDGQEQVSQPIAYPETMNGEQWCMPSGVYVA